MVVCHASRVKVSVFGALFWCAVLGGAVATGIWMAGNHRANWYDLGLLAAVPCFSGATWLAWLFNRHYLRGHVAAAMIIGLIVGFPLFWLYCMVYVPTGSWIWATVTTVLVAYLGLDYISYRAKKRATSQGKDRTQVKDADWAAE
jgi:hypothetical protein